MRLFVFLLGLALTAESAAAEEAFQPVQEHCAAFWSSFNGRCYRYISSMRSWADAEIYCVSQGTNLVSVHSEEEHNYVNSLIKHTDLDQRWTWIGLTDHHKDGSWMWSDGSRADYLNWHTGEPNNHNGPENCGHTNFGRVKKWNDQSCSDNLPFVCATRRGY